MCVRAFLCSGACALTPHFHVGVRMLPRSRCVCDVHITKGFNTRQSKSGA